MLVQNHHVLLFHHLFDIVWFNYQATLDLSFLGSCNFSKLLDSHFNTVAVLRTLFEDVPTFDWYRSQQVIEFSEVAWFRRGLLQGRRLNRSGRGLMQESITIRDQLTDFLIMIGDFTSHVLFFSFFQDYSNNNGNIFLHYRIICIYLRTGFLLFFFYSSTYRFLNFSSRLQ